MNERISALVDGEQAQGELAPTLEALHEAGEARETWRRYHLISDALRDTPLTSPGFAARIAARLEAEPTVLAPSRLPAAAPEPRRWVPLYAAASVAAVALVGWIALAPQSGPETAPVAAVAPKPVPVAAKEPAKLPLTDAANDYLLAHQAYSPRNSFQGVAPYVRTVADRAPAERRR